MKSVLFVCLGNICRSPAAEAILQKKLKLNALESLIYVDSAGTSGHHVGDLPDKRMIVAAKKRGVELLSRARQFDPFTDFERFDWIITMDNSNYNYIQSVAPNSESLKRVYKAVAFLSRTSVDQIPDPYYGGLHGFELVLDLLDDCADGVLAEIKITL